MKAYVVVHQCVSMCVNKVIKYGLTQFTNFLFKNIQRHVSALRNILQAEHKVVYISNCRVYIKLLNFQ
jgi:hypothetical protein